MPRRVVFFHLLNNYTGSPQVLSNVLEVAAKNDIDYKLYTSQTEGFLSKFRSTSNFYKRSNIRLLTLFSFFFSQFILAIRLILSNKKDEDTFYVNTILPFGAILVGRMLNKQVITHIHETEISPKLLSKFLFWVVRNFSSKVLVVSKFLQRNPNLKGVEAKVIYNCVTADFEAQAVKGRDEVKVFDVLMLASLRPYKGLNEFIHLAGLNVEQSFTLILSDSKKDVDDFLADKKLPDNLQVFPVQKEVVKFYKNASLVVNLAHTDKWVETFGMTVLEGMHYGLPAIVPNAGGITELVEEGVNGFQINYTDLEQISSKINLMDKDHSYWENLSRGALQRKSEFSRKTFESQILNLLEK